jgi:hypothetical protein
MALHGPEGETDDEAYLRYRFQKRRRNLMGGTIGGPVGESVESDDADQLDEVLNLAQRRKKALKLNIIRKKVELGRKRALSRPADIKRLKNRAEKEARTMIFKRLSKGLSKDQVPYQRRMEIEKRMSKMTARIQRLAIKLLPKVRQLDVQRRTNKDQEAQNEK